MLTNTVNKLNKVELFMATFEHPLKAEVQAIREIILNVNKNISEAIKWHAPTFSYKNQYLTTFNLNDKQRVRLILLNGAILNDKTGLLEGTDLNQRLVYFSNMDDVKAKRTALESAIRKLIRLMDEQ